MSIPVSSELFRIFSEWAITQPDVADLAVGAETWRDAPCSNTVVGIRAVNGGADKYNRIGDAAWAKFLDATGTEVESSTVFSDRTGSHRCIKLKGWFDRQRLAWAESMALSEARKRGTEVTAYVIADGSTHFGSIPHGCKGVVHSATATPDGLKSSMRLVI